MSGHSHWARIKRAKSVTDARRGRAWSKLARAVIIAARQGGGDPETNLTLRYAIDAAKAENMPKDTIERAIKKGTGEIEGAEYVELVFEGYGPGGAAILCTVLTDNRNRTAPQIKKIFEKHGGSLGAANSVAWMFSSRLCSCFCTKSMRDWSFTDSVGLCRISWWAISSARARARSGDVSRTAISTSCVLGTSRAETFPDQGT